MNQPDKTEILTDPRAMRVVIYNFAHGVSSLDGKTYGGRNIIPPPWVRYLLRKCEIEGFSGEDTMVVIAYHALLEYEGVMRILLDEQVNRPFPFGLGEKK